MYSSLLLTFAVLMLSTQVYAQLDNFNTHIASSVQVQPPALATESCIVLFSGSVPAFTITSEFARPTHHERNGTFFNVTFPTGGVRNNTHTLFATVVTSLGVASTVFASSSLQVVPTGWPICPDTSLYGNSPYSWNLFSFSVFTSSSFLPNSLLPTAPTRRFPTSLQKAKK